MRILSGKGSERRARLGAPGVRRNRARRTCLPPARPRLECQHREIVPRTKEQARRGRNEDHDYRARRCRRWLGAPARTGWPRSHDTRTGRGRRFGRRRRHGRGSGERHRGCDREGAGVEGKTVLDATNPLEGRPDGIDSLAQQVKSLTHGPVAKAFNANFERLYSDVSRAGNRPSALYCGDDGRVRWQSS